MSGIIVPILEKRTFEYGFLTGPGTQDVVLHPAIDVGNWYRVRLVVLVHQISASSGNFVFKLQHTFPCENDRQEFVDTATDFLATASITNASPNIKTITGTDPQAFLKVVLRATQVTTGTTLYGEFSAYLVLRDV